MQKLKITGSALVLAMLTLPATATAGSWICEQGNLIREIKVEREATPAPCSVVYDKSSEGQGTKVLWTAQVDGAYCHEKADGLAVKLQGFGWTCSAF